MVLTAESVPALFVDAVHFKENLAKQMAVLQTGRSPLAMTKQERTSLNGPRGFHVNKLWKNYVGLGKSRGLLENDWSDDARAYDDA